MLDMNIPAPVQHKHEPQGIVRQNVGCGSEVAKTLNPKPSALSCGARRPFENVGRQDSTVLRPSGLRI